MTPTPELLPADTEPCQLTPVVGFCSLCGECVLADQGHAYFPGAAEPLLLCGECIRRHDDWNAPVQAFDLGGECG